MKRKSLAFILVIIMIVSLWPAAAFAAEHSHDYINGLCSCGACDGTHPGWTNWGDDDSEKTSMPTQAGIYYLTSNIELSSPWVVPTGEVNFCLNGCVINLKDGGYSVIKVPSGATLNLYDCGTTEHYFNVDSTTGLWTLTNAAVETTKTISGGCITGGKNGIGGAICLTDAGTVGTTGATLNFYGGNIVGNQSTSTTEGGGAVFVAGQSTFNMYGGNIVGNNATHNGGAVYINGTCNMYGGTIKDNTADYIGGVTVNGTFTMYDGTISDNRAIDPNEGTTGGVCVMNESGATFIMNGGIITRNSAYSLGGGVTVQRTFKMNGGEISHNTSKTPKGTESVGGGVCVDNRVPVSDFFVGGSAKIVDNTAGPENSKVLNNVWLDDGKTITIGTKTQDAEGNGVLAPEEGMSVGIKMKNDGIFTSNTVTLDDAKYFKVDAADKGIVYESGKLKLVSATGNHIHNGINFFGTDMLPVSAGDYYLTTNVAIGSTWNVPTGGPVNLCLNGYVIKANAISSSFRAITIPSGATLNLYDCAATPHYFTYSSTDAWTWNGDTESADAISVDEITDTTTDGALIIVTGGCITGGNTNNGGGVSIANGGTLKMYGGNIVGNGAEEGGGVCLAAESSTFIMTGGLITGNKADKGGGVAKSSLQCLAAGTPITLSNGAVELIENLQRGDEVKVFDHETGEVSGAKLFDVWKYPEKRDNVFTLHFSNNIDVTVVGGHCFYERKANKYVSVTKYNADEYIGHEFYNLDAGGWETLNSISYLEGTFDTYLIVSEKTLNCSANGMLSNEDGIYEWLINAFEFDDNMKVDSVKKSSAVQENGSWSYEDCPGFSERVFDALNLQYMPILFGKGQITPAQFDELVEYSLAIDPELYGAGAVSQPVLLQSKTPLMMMLGAAADPVEGLAFGGTSRVIGNSKDNVYLSDYNSITVGTGSNGVQAPQTGMSVYVTMLTPGAFTSNGGQNDAGYFHSDNNKYEVVCVSDHLELQEIPTPPAPDYYDDSYTPKPENKMPFVDVSETAYYYDAVKWAAANGITDGKDATHFNPSGIANRGQMVTFLWRAAGCPEPKTASCKFTDIKSGSYYYKAVLWAVENGITEGTTSTTFSPGKTVTRGQAVTFLARLNGVKDNAAGYSHNFTDVDSGSKFSNAIAWAYANKITDGKTATTFAPKESCLRGQIVTYLYRSFVK